MNKSAIFNGAKYNHVEAFCLMYYQSRPADKHQTKWFNVWNSRDGVTPFCVIEDGVEFYHENWKQDKCLPNFELPDGHRYFRDTTPNEAAYIALQRLNFYQASDHAIEYGSEKWYQAWGRVTEGLIGQPIMRQWCKKEHLIERLQPLLARCRAEGMWLHNDSFGLFFTPDELESSIAAGSYLYYSWTPVKPSEGLKTLKIEAHNARVEVKKWEEKMRVNGFEVPE